MIDNGKFKNKYHIASARLQSWDYRWNGAYFITICTQDKEHYFGEIADGKMHLSHIGVLADVFWHEIKNHAQNIELGEFMVMPNHVHGVLILNNNNYSCRDDACIVSTDTGKNVQMAKISPKSGSVSRIIGSYKSAVTKHAHRLGYTFTWQSRFHDHIIRNEESFNKIREYTINNPKNWEHDKFYA